jgi:hypothetical protein
MGQGQKLVTKWAKYWLPNIPKIGRQVGQKLVAKYTKNQLPNGPKIAAKWAENWPAAKLHILCLQFFN